MSIKVKVGQSSKIRIVAAAEKKPLITPDSITLGIDTVGQYVAKIDAGSGIIVTPELNLENANLVISHAATTTEISSNNAGLVFAGNIDIDQYGHITQFNNRSLSSTNFSYSNTVISTNDITLGTTALTAGETSNTIVGLTSFEAGGVELFNRTFTANGDISFEPGSNNVIDMGFSRITGVSSPTDGFDAVNKTYLAFELERVENTVKVITDPILDSDATNKRYVDNLVTGFVVRPQALAATTADLSAAFEEGNTSVRDTLTIPPVNFLYIDDVTTWTIGANLLVKDQTDASENGSYNVKQIGSANTAWIFERADFSTNTELPGSYEFVTDGTINGGTGWVATVEDASNFNLNTDLITWAQFQGEGTFTAGTGLNLNGTQFSVAQTLLLDTINPVGGNLTVSGTGAITLPQGSSANRPTEIAGQIRFNTEDVQFEGYDGVAWAGLGGTVDVDQDTKVIAENSPGSDDDQLQFFTGGSLAAKMDINNVSTFYGDVHINALGATLKPNAPGVMNLGASNFNFDKVFTSKIGSDDQLVRIDTTGALVMPKGTTLERPVGIVGGLRYNTEDARFEGYDGTAWAGLAGSVMDLDRNTYIIAETAAGVDNNDLDFYTANTQRMQIDQDGDLRFGVGLNKIIFDYATGNLEVNTKIISGSDLVLDPTGNIDAANNTITNVADPVNLSDVVTLNYLGGSFSSKLQIEDGANTHLTDIDLLQNPTLNLGRGLELQNIDSANNELKIGLDVTGVTPGTVGNDGFTTRIRITEDGRIDFATEIPLELQANAIPNFTETSRDIIGLMFTDGNANNEGIIAVNDDVGDVMNLKAENFNISLAGDLIGSSQVTRLSNTEISATITADYVSDITPVGPSSGISITQPSGPAANVAIGIDYSHVDTHYATLAGATFSGNIFAPRYFDSDNSAYFMDPAGESRLNQMRIGFGLTTSQISFADGVGSQSTLYAGGGRIGFLDNTFNFSAYSERSTGNWIVNNDVKAERFVDTDDETYLLDPDGSSRLHTVIVTQTQTVANVKTEGRTISTVAASGFDLTLNSDTNEINVSSNKITNLADPTSTQDAATKSYVDATAQGLRVIPAALAATTADLGGTYAFNSGASTIAIPPDAVLNIDGVITWSLGDKILVKDQTNADENGSYELTTIGDISNPFIITRGEYFNQSSEIPGAFQFVTDGTLNASTGYVATVADAETFTLGSDDITFYQFSGAGTYTAGNALTLTGNEFSVTNPQITIIGEAGANQDILLGGTLEFEGTDGVNTTISSGKVSIKVDEIDGGSF